MTLISALLVWPCLHVSRRYEFHRDHKTKPQEFPQSLGRIATSASRQKTGIRQSLEFFNQKRGKKNPNYRRLYISVIRPRRYFIWTAAVVVEKGNDQTRVEVDQMSLTTTRTRLGTTWEFDDDKPLDRRKRSIDQILSGNLLFFFFSFFFLQKVFLFSTFFRFLMMHKTYGTAYTRCITHGCGIITKASRPVTRRHFLGLFAVSHCLCFSLVRSVGHFAFCREYL